MCVCVKCTASLRAHAWSHIETSTNMMKKKNRSILLPLSSFLSKLKIIIINNLWSYQRLRGVFVAFFAGILYTNCFDVRSIERVCVYVLNFFCFCYVCNIHSFTRVVLFAKFVSYVKEFCVFLFLHNVFALAPFVSSHGIAFVWGVWVCVSAKDIYTQIFRLYELRAVVSPFMICLHAFVFIFAFPSSSLFFSCTLFSSTLFTLTEAALNWRFASFTRYIHYFIWIASMFSLRFFFVLSLSFYSSSLWWTIVFRIEKKTTPVRDKFNWSHQCKNEDEYVAFRAAVQYATIIIET